MNTSVLKNKKAYNQWSTTYDSVQNETRDLEAVACRKVLSQQIYSDVLELGCGTGKNTEWLLAKANDVTGIDFSEEMLQKAKQKMIAAHVSFVHADITKKWTFLKSKVDLITSSLVLEHIRDLDFIFNQAANNLKASGLFYIGELHPYKQYQGSKARFETSAGVYELDCFIHHISDYVQCAENNGFRCIQLKEWFDDDDKNETPRLVTFLFLRDEEKSNGVKK